MTASDMPLASATRERGVDLPRVSARARARIPATLRDGKVGARAVSAGAAAARAGRIVARDGRRWWLVAARPVSLRAWLRAQRPAAARVPDGSVLLRRAWLVDNWTSGLLLRVAAVALYLTAGALTYLAGHPLRRWSAFLLGAMALAWLVLA
jgi:hypothetical protein